MTCNELIVVGDRVFTDVVLANRMRMQKRNVLPQLSEDYGKNDSRGPLAIWTTGVWERESMFMRWMEKGLVNVIERWTTPSNGPPFDTARFIRDLPPTLQASRRSGIVEELSSIFFRT